MMASSFYFDYVVNKHNRDKYFDISFLRDADFEFKKDLNGDISSLELFDSNHRIHVCGKSPFRTHNIFDTVYSEIEKRNVKQIIELGVGINDFYASLSSFSFDYKVIEVNTKLCDYLNKEYIVCSEFHNYINNNNFENTAFVVRLPISYFKNIYEYFKYLKQYTKHFNKNNYLVIEKGMSTFEPPNTIFSIKHDDSVDIYTHIIKL